MSTPSGPRRGRRPHPSGVAVDVVVLSLRDDAPVFLAVRRERPPFEGAWALPGVLLGEDEGLEDAAARALERAAHRSMVRHLEQLATFGGPGRDPRGRVVSVSYLALLPEPVAVAERARWRDAVPPPELAFDHTDILGTAVERLRGKLSYSNVAFGLLPDRFTLSELQAVYEAVLGHALDKRNFRKKVLGVGLLAEAQGQRRGAHRPAQLYRFAQRGLALLDPPDPAR